MVHTPQRAHRAAQTASAHATGTIYHTHHRTAYSEPDSPTDGMCCGSTMVHTHRNTHSEPDRSTPAQCTTPTIGQPTARLSLYHVGTPHRGTHSLYRWNALRLYAMRARTHTHRNGYSAPQHMLPAQYTTPTIGQPTASLSLYHVGTPHRGTHSPTAPAAALPWYTHHRAQERLQRAHRAGQIHTGTMHYRTASAGARIYTANRNTRTGRARTQCTHHRGEIPPAPPFVYCIY